jgi:hypothetical protein
MILSGVYGVLYIGIGVMLLCFTASDPWPTNLVFWVSGAVNLACGARMLSRAYREAYDYDE